MLAETAGTRPPLLPVETALARILDEVPRTAIEHLPLQQAHGRILAAPLASRLTMHGSCFNPTTVSFALR